MLQTEISFQDLPLSASLQQAIADMNFTHPTPIQAAIIPLFLQGKDIIGQAQTGTGKTAAFAIPAIEKLDKTESNTQTLILCPTRELAVQVADECKKLTQYEDNIYAVAIYGGDSMEKQIKFLKRNAQIVVGTPGRVLDHIRRKTLSLANITTVILDEADEMLNMGFYEDISTILQQLPEERQTVLLSATMPKPIVQLAKNFQNDPELIKIKAQELTNTSIEQQCFFVNEDKKLPLMLRLIALNDYSRMLAFCNTKQRVDDLVEMLRQHQIPVEGLHGDMSQAQRNMVMKRFKAGQLKLLVATDVAARGIDVNDIEAVFNYDLPFDPEYYVHRIGRTGRAGKNGVAYSFILRKEKGRLRDIERYSQTNVQEGKVPSLEEIKKQKQINWLEKLINDLKNTEIHTAHTILSHLQTQGFENQQIAAYFIEKQAQALIPDYLSTQNELEIEAKENFRSRERGDRDNREYGRGKEDKNSRSREKSKPQHKGAKTFLSHNTTRLFLNVGKSQRVSKGDILGAITNEVGLKGSQIGEIDIYEKFSFVDVSSEVAPQIIKTMSKARIKGNKVYFEIAE
ncbi:MAG: DEAD/DEAH box helicase [Cytophagales bacterium]|nr:MAG: DEAD/DEAH box helicase [Cytophagales bacterium]